MATGNLETAVLMIGYRRADLMARVLARVAEARPRRLYIALDGPADDAVIDACAAVRALFDGANFPWVETLKYNIATTNLGCAERVRSAIDWVFETEPTAIILEDDTLPAREWFGWAEQMLDTHRDDPQAGMVCARNALVTWPADGVGYFRSRWSTIWGWATWRARWQAHRAQPLAAPEAVRQRWPDDPEIGAYRAYLAKSDIGARQDTWDYAWGLWLEANALDNLVPARNWAENIGFDHRATHTHKHTDLRGSEPVAAPDTPTLERPNAGFDILALLSELIYSGMLQDPRKWELLARNRDKLPLPGQMAGWEAYLLPYKRPALTRRLLDHLSTQIGSEPPEFGNLRAALVRWEKAAT